jgi:uncharacterized protein YggU (UPF0235/DUF167 family)
MYVKVDVFPKHKKEQIKVIKEDWLEICVKEPAEQNLANYRVREIVARQYGVKTTETRIIAGHQSRRKIISLDKS